MFPPMPVISALLAQLGTPCRLSDVIATLATKIEAIKTANDRITDDQFGERLGKRMAREEGGFSRGTVAKWKAGDRGVADEIRAEINKWYFESVDALRGQDVAGSFREHQEAIGKLASLLNPRNLERARKLIDDLYFEQQLQERGLKAVPSSPSKGQDDGSEPRKPSGDQGLDAGDISA